ncbi:hypothetical protein DFS34DRAFT_632405 [Phlyctochytrium arcticum]|nr:hypothetical protein DFS34DRAFT_632405 [Phlyctochytrium arcticum]
MATLKMAESVDTPTQESSSQPGTQGTEASDDQPFFNINDILRNGVNTSPSELNLSQIFKTRPSHRSGSSFFKPAAPKPLKFASDVSSGNESNSRETLQAIPTSAATPPPTEKPLETSPLNRSVSTTSVPNFKKFRSLAAPSAPSSSLQTHGSPKQFNSLNRPVHNTPSNRSNTTNTSTQGNGQENSHQNISQPALGSSKKPLTVRDRNAIDRTPRPQPIFPDKPQHSRMAATRMPTLTSPSTENLFRRSQSMRPQPLTKPLTPALAAPVRSLGLSPNPPKLPPAPSSKLSNPSVSKLSQDLSRLKAKLAVPELGSKPRSQPSTPTPLLPPSPLPLMHVKTPLSVPRPILGSNRLQNLKASRKLVSRPGTELHSHQPRHSQSLANNSVTATSLPKNRDDEIQRPSQPAMLLLGEENPRTPTVPKSIRPMSPPISSSLPTPLSERHPARRDPDMPSPKDHPHAAPRVLDPVKMPKTFLSTAPSFPATAAVPEAKLHQSPPPTRRGSIVQEGRTQRAFADSTSSVPKKPLMQTQNLPSPNSKGENPRLQPNNPASLPNPTAGSPSPFSPPRPQGFASLQKIRPEPFTSGVVSSNHPIDNRTPPQNLQRSTSYKHNLQEPISPNLSPQKSPALRASYPDNFKIPQDIVPRRSQTNMHSRSAEDSTIPLDPQYWQRHCSDLISESNKSTKQVMDETNQSNATHLAQQMELDNLDRAMAALWRDLSVQRAKMVGLRFEVMGDVCDMADFSKLHDEDSKLVREEQKDVEISSVKTNPTSVASSDSSVLDYHEHDEHGNETDSSL